MPDYVDNIIELKNNQEFTEEQVNKMKELFTNENGEFDFNKFVPQPYPMFLIDLNDETLKKYSAFYKYFKDKISGEKMREILSDKKAWFRLDEGNMLVSNFIDFWYSKKKLELSDDEMLPNWYDWNIEHWGTKWNACESNISKGCIFFQTAWDPISDELLLGIKDKMKDILTEEQIKDLQYGFKPTYADYYRMEDFADLKSASK